MKTRASLVSLLFATLLTACADDSSTTETAGGSSGGATGFPGIGGSSQGGASQGGSASGGTAQGGSASGGKAQAGNGQGGSAQGGKAQGGQAQGGEAQGGQAQGGEAQGGQAQGGDSQGGQAQGGDAQGGQQQGGAAGEGGQGVAGQAGAGGEAAGGAAGAGGEAGAAGSSGGEAGQGGVSGGGGASQGGSGGSAAGAAGQAGSSQGGQAGASACGTPTQCAAVHEQAASDRYDVAIDNPDELDVFLFDMPKGADLHNHLSGAIYAETYLAWAKAGNDCINSTSFAAVLSGGSCPAGAVPAPDPGPFYDSVVRAWSMKDFVPGAETGHDHFFATFGKFGAIAGIHRDDSIADLLARAEAENVLYIETMFNMGKNIGNLSTAIWSGTLTEAALSGLYDSIIADPTFASELAKDVAVVDDAASTYRAQLGCDGANPKPGCGVGVRFIAQISRTGAKDMVFGQLISAFEMARKTKNIVGANLSSPEDDTTSLNNYNLHMAMLDFLHKKYKDTSLSPLHITLHAGELTPKYLPSGHANDITFHIRKAVELGHAERIGHGLDVLSETDPQGLLAEMAQRKVMVEVCLSSNVQILEVSGSAHPLSAYMNAGVPVALATDDEGVSRSSMAGEYARGALDQHLTYRELKTMARTSLEHAFLPGESLWASFDGVSAVAACAPTDTMGLGDTPSASCKAFLDGSERAAMQWELERRFRVFESQQ